MTTLSPDFQNVSLSSATMREEDLLPTFMDFIRTYVPSEWKLIAPSWRAIVNWDNYIQHHPETCSEFLNEYLFDILNDVAPDGYYFGSHPGDGSDFGFWEIEED